MPWVLKRYYTNDGRLILRKEKVRHHEYFRAHRCNGRLTLHLVPLDDEVSALPFVFNHERRYGIENDLECNDIEEDEQVLEQEHEEEQEENESLVEESTDVEVNGNDGENDYCVKNVDSDDTLEEEEEEEEVVHDDKRVPSVESSGSAGKCLNYSSVRTSSTCIFGVPVPAVRPVHS
jgi:TATA-binding protein-associated factor Taf7